MFKFLFPLFLVQTAWSADFISFRGQKYECRKNADKTTLGEVISCTLKFPTMITLRTGQTVEFDFISHPEGNEYRLDNGFIYTSVPMKAAGTTRSFYFNENLRITFNENDEVVQAYMMPGQLTTQIGNYQTEVKYSRISFANGNGYISYDSWAIKDIGSFPWLLIKDPTKDEYGIDAQDKFCKHLGFDGWARGSFGEATTDTDEILFDTDLMQEVTVPPGKYWVVSDDAYCGKSNITIQL